MANDLSTARRLYNAGLQQSKDVGSAKGHLEAKTALRRLDKLEKLEKSDKVDSLNPERVSTSHKLV